MGTKLDIAGRKDVRELVRRALDEDMGSGDVTSDALIGPRQTARAAIVARESCIFCGGTVAALVFQTLDKSLRVRNLAGDGQWVVEGNTVMEIRGRAGAILAAERTALNFLQRMSGIATLTSRFVARVSVRGVSILDTRKTTPSLRMLEKYAVASGGGRNHRMGLYDMALVKDNHRALWKTSRKADLGKAVEAVRRRHPGVPVEIEVESVRELREVLPARPDWVLLDNMPVPAMRACVRLCRGKCKVEASGGITLGNVGRVAAAGVDAISLGCLTHSAPAADFSLEVEA